MKNLRLQLLHCAGEREMSFVLVLGIEIIGFEIFRLAGEEIVQISGMHRQRLKVDIPIELELLFVKLLVSVPKHQKLIRQMVVQVLPFLFRRDHCVSPFL